MPNVMKILVTSFDPETDETILSRTIDFNDIEQRKWYIKNFWWAILNNKGIEVVRVPSETVDSASELRLFTD
jgi:hypothetical protein